MATPEEVAEQAAKAASNTTKETVREVVTGAEDAIAAAKAEMERASKTAEQISQAAMQTEIGTRVAKHDEEINAWRASDQQRATELQELRSQNSQLTTMLQGQQSILEKLTRPPQKPLEEGTVIVEPEKASNTTKMEASDKKEVGNPVAEPKPQQRQRRFL